MPRDFSRVERINEMMQRELAMLISREVKDPRMPKLVSVSGVEVSRDLSYAKVYISLLEEDREPQEVIDILNHASGYLRSALAKIMKLRTIPQLKFIHDSSISYGNRLSALIDEAIKREQGDDK